MSAAQPHSVYSVYSVVKNPGWNCLEFLIDGERDFVLLYMRSPELNSVATEVRTGALKAAGLKLGQKGQTLL